MLLKKIFILTALFCSHCIAMAEDGYELWLRYRLIPDHNILTQYKQQITALNINESSPTLLAASNELQHGLSGLLGVSISNRATLSDNSVLAGTRNSSKEIAAIFSTADLLACHEEGYLIKTFFFQHKKMIAIAANSDIGILYGIFHFLRLLQTNQNISMINITSSPKIKLRILDHWDNLNRSVERGYAGISVWNWHTLPGYIDQRYVDYARANASIGINGTVLTNVNANALVLTREYLEKVAALANTFRPYGIKVYLTARFSAPVEIGGLKTADPLDPGVKQWWKEKVKEIYQYIPDFGRFLIKANSEGQPGPQNYNRTHADGANMFADALAPFHGIVMWRAFVYSSDASGDRFKQAYDEFKPLNGKFRPNILLQVKNGPIDFQPREPFHPLFGAMPQTPLMMEFQLTQEYLGFATHLVFLPVLQKEVLNTDTHTNGNRSTVSMIIEGGTETHSLSGMAGVANIGNERNWCGHPFAQANWYGLGRLAWNDTLSAAAIAEEWIRQTFSNNSSFVDTVKKIMLASRETLVNYMTPLGLHHIMGNGHHYGPAPWSDNLPRPDWNPVYYHKADAAGIGFDRTAAGSNALAQYAPEVRKQYEDENTCDEEYLLWFHHVAWDHSMRSGHTLWDEMCYKYDEGVKGVTAMQRQWNTMENFIDHERFQQVKMLLAIQQQEAQWWRNACLLYFQTFSKMPFPIAIAQPSGNLDYYKSLKFPFAPGN